MATSTAPIRDRDIVGVIVALQTGGAPLTAEEVYREVRRRQMPCRRATVQAVVRSWRQQQRQAADVAPCPVAPPPLGVDRHRQEICIVQTDSVPENAEIAYVPLPVSHLVALRAQVAQLDVYGYAIYTVLYRYSYGYSRSTCALSYGQIAKELKISSKKAELVLADLESRGLIEVLFPPFKKLRGKVYKVKLPRNFVKENEARLSRDVAFQELRRMGVL